VLVFEGGLPPDYVDSLAIFDLPRLLQGVYRASRNVWEANRLVAYVVASVNSKNRLSLFQIARFPWEGGTKKEKNFKQVVNAWRQVLKKHGDKLAEGL
jgi:hypothetical protein